MPDETDWSVTTWDGNRLRQHQEFMALAFREKIEVVEHLGETAAFFAARRRARGQAVRPETEGP